MIPYASRGVTTCGSCEKQFDYDIHAAKRKPRTCPRCKDRLLEIREVARRAKFTPSNGVSLEPLAVMSYDEVGEKLGISGERVRQIERRALAKLKEMCIQMQIDNGGIMEKDSRCETMTPRRCT